MRLSEIDSVLIDSVDKILSREVVGEWREMLAESRDLSRRSIVQLRELYDFYGDESGWSHFRRSFLNNIGQWHLGRLLVYEESPFDSLNLLWLISPDLFVYICCGVLFEFFSFDSSYSSGRDRMWLIMMASSGLDASARDAARELYDGCEYSDVLDFRLGQSDIASTEWRQLEYALLETMFMRPICSVQISIGDVEETIVYNMALDDLRTVMRYDDGSKSPLDGRFHVFVRDMLNNFENGIFYKSKMRR